MGKVRRIKRVMLFLVVLIIFSSLVFADSININHQKIKEWIYNNYPIFTEEGIQLELRDSFQFS